MHEAILHYILLRHVVILNYMHGNYFSKHTFIYVTMTGREEPTEYQKIERLSFTLAFLYIVSLSL
jgi:hypothetical protein